LNHFSFIAHVYHVHMPPNLRRVNMTRNSFSAHPPPR
jgi:hypothetical protein